MESWAMSEHYADPEAFSVEVMPNIAGAGIGTLSYRGSTVGYFASVGTSTLLFWTMTAIGIGRWPETSISLPVTTLFVGGIIFAAATTLGMLPAFLVTLWAARKTATDNAGFYATCGLVSAVVLGVIATAMIRQSILTDAEPLPFLGTLEQSFYATGLRFACSGAVGGLTYWFIAARRATPPQKA